MDQGTSPGIGKGRQGSWNLWPAAAGTRQWLGRKRPTHPVFWAPGAMVKKELWADGDHQLAISTGGLYAPPLLNLLARDGIGGVLAPDIVVPTSKAPSLIWALYIPTQSAQHDGLALMWSKALGL